MPVALCKLQLLQQPQQAPLACTGGTFEVSKLLFEAVAAAQFPV